MNFIVSAQPKIKMPSLKAAKMPNFVANFVRKHTVLKRWKERNEKEVVLPFLTALGCEYLLFQQFVFVKDSPESQKAINAIYTQTEEESIALLSNYIPLEFGKTYYFYNFNISLNIVEEKAWNAIKLASDTLDQLTFSHMEEMMIFHTIVRTVLSGKSDTVVYSSF